MNFGRKLGWLALGVLVSGAAVSSWSLWSRDGRSNEPEAVAPSESLDELLLDSPAEGASQPAPAIAPDLPPQIGGPPDRERVEPVRRVRIIDGVGAGVGSARVSITPLSADDLALAGRFADSDRRRLKDAGRQILADPRGVVDLGTATEVLPVQVVWVSRAGYLASSFVLRSTSVADGLPDVVRLAAAPAMEVQVVREDGRPADGARLVQRAVRDRNRFPNSDEALARELYWREDEADASGRVELGVVPGDQELSAIGPGGAQARWQGPPRPLLQMVLRRSFLLQGEVRFEGASGEQEGLLVSCAAVRGTMQQELGSTAVDEQGLFGPIAIPLVDAEVFRVVLAGGAVVPVHVEFVPPAPGETNSVALSATLGTSLWLQIVDRETQELLKNAEGMVRWLRDGVELQSRGWAAAREDGWVEVPGCPPGAVVAVGRCEGYASVASRSILMPEGAAIGVLIDLAKGSAIAGHVVLEGQPVEDFSIAFWTETQRGNAAEHVFTGRQDGSFRIEAADQDEDLHMFGWSPTCPRTKSIAVAKAEREDILIELQRGVSARGRVVDRLTRKPIAAASAQVWGNEGTDPLLPTGAAVGADASGEFVVQAVPIGRGVLQVQAKGYAPARIETNVDAGQAEVDLGLITLSPSSSLTLRVLGEGALAGRTFRIYGDGPSVVPNRVLSGDGSAKLEGLGPGYYNLNLDRDDGFFYAIQVRMEPGKDGMLEVPLTGPCQVEIEVKHDERAALSPSAVMSVDLPLPRSATGVVLRNFQACFTSLEETIVVGVQPGIGKVVLTDGADTLGAAKFVVSPGDTVVRVTVSPNKVPLRLRVVDERGSAVANAYVSMTDPEDRAFWESHTTDAEGRCRFSSFAPGDHFVHLSHDTLGRRFGIPVQVRAEPQDEIELVLEAKSSVVVLFLDGNEPQAGVDCTLLDHTGIHPLLSRSSDGSGVVRWGNLARDEYLLRVEHPQYWWIEAKVPSSEADAPTTVQVRRLGGLELQVISARGGVANGTRVELMSIELQESVADWLRSGRCRSAAEELVTDSTGYLIVEGIPHGMYRWAIVGVDGAIDHGLLEVLPGELSRSTAMLQ